MSPFVRAVDELAGRVALFVAAATVLGGPRVDHRISPGSRPHRTAGSALTLPFGVLLVSSIPPMRPGFCSSLSSRASERLFGYADVGTDRQEEAELSALADPMLVAAVDAIELGIELLAARVTDPPTLEALRAGLTPISP